MTSLSSDSCFSGGNLCRRLDITDDDDDIVSLVPAEAAVSLGPFVVALARLGQHNTYKTTASPVCRSVLLGEGGQIVSTLYFNSAL